MIIDFRLRPPYEGYVNSQTYDRHTIAWVNRIMGTNTPDGPAAALQGSMRELISEMDAAGVTMGVAPGRHRPGTEIPNQVLRRLKEEFPGRFEALASVDVVDIAHGVAMVDEGVGEHRFPGISLDLSVLELRVNDKRLFPLYEHCSKYACCIAITLSLLGAKELELIHPSDLDRVAREFPNVNFVSAHGSYPYALEVIAVAMKRENVWISPDMYLNYAPGRHLYTEAAQGYLQDRMLFGTGYPYTPLKEAVSRFHELPFKATVFDKLLYKNAQRLMSIAN